MKYGLLRTLQTTGAHKLLVAWMLTADDGGSDGKFRDYLQEPEKWEHYDPELYSWISTNDRSQSGRDVSLIADSGLLSRARYYSKEIEDDAESRHVWFQELMSAADGVDIVFLDPDNGIQVKSKPYGKASSSKYVFWSEIEALWNGGSSILIYQHFPREKRDKYIERMLAEIREHTGAFTAFAIRTSRVVFFLAAQACHEESLREALKNLRDQWKSKFSIVKASAT